MGLPGSGLPGRDVAREIGGNETPRARAGSSTGRTHPSGSWRSVAEGLQPDRAPAYGGAGMGE